MALLSFTDLQFVESIATYLQLVCPDNVRDVGVRQIEAPGDDDLPAVQFRVQFREPAHGGVRGRGGPPRTDGGAGPNPPLGTSRSRILP